MINKINQFEKTLGQERLNKPNPNAPAGFDGKTKSASAADQVTLSTTRKTEASPGKSQTGVRDHLVSKFRGILESEEYKIKSAEIADKIVQKIGERKNHTLLF